MTELSQLPGVCQGGGGQPERGVLPRSACSSDLVGFDSWGWGSIEKKEETAKNIQIQTVIENPVI